MASIKDVAAAAGVSPTTVSHALNNRGRIAEETRTRVLEAARQLGYQANAHAQQLVTRRSRIIAIQMPDLGVSEGPALPHSAYFLDVINGAAATADSSGYALVVTPSGGKARIFGSFAIDGAIVVDPQGDEPVFDTGAPVVTVGVLPQHNSGALAVDNDHAAAAGFALDQFAGLGRTRPAIIADNTHRSYVGDVLNGYLDWARRRGTEPIVVTLDTLDPAAVDSALASLVGHSADAVYASSDDLALAVLDAASRGGVHVPSDLAVASAVDSRSLTLTSPQISATDLFPFRTGATAARLLIEQLEGGGPNTATSHYIPTRFMSRASTATSA